MAPAKKAKTSQKGGTTSRPAERRSLNLEQIQQLINVVENSGISELEFIRDKEKLVIKKSPTQATVNWHQTPIAGPPPAVVSPTVETPVVPPAPASTEPPPALEPEQNLAKIISPIVGTFYQAVSPEAAPLVKENDYVKKGQTVCIVEAMKIMNEIESEVNGVVRKICVENGHPVEYGQTLFLVEPS